jgi:hypothetical protein
MMKGPKVEQHPWDQVVGDYEGRDLDLGGKSSSVCHLEMKKYVTQT